MADFPYENATSGDKALSDIQKLLQGFGCTQFGTMFDEEIGEIRVMFKWNNRNVVLPANYKGWAAAYLKRKPYGSRTRGSKTDYERKALKQAKIAVYSILRDWIKGQVTAVECNILTFEGAFLGQIMLPSGKSVMDHVTETDVLKITHD